MRKKIAQKSDCVITLSEYVKGLVKNIYDIESEVVLLSQNIKRYGQYNDNNDTAIFNNKQLKLLLTHLPKDTVELNHLKILEPVKVNFYMIKKSLISLMRMLTFKLTY